MKKLIAIALGVTLIALAPAAMAGDPQTTCQPTQTLSADCGQGGCDESLAIGERIWFSYGRNFWNIDARTLTPPTIEQFKYHKLYSTVFETNLDAVTCDCFVAHLDIGAGRIDHGDFLFSALGEEDRRGGGSLTPIFDGDVKSDNLFYVTADVGYRLLCTGCGNCEGGCKVTVDALVGYQYWRERDVASNLALAFPPFTQINGLTFDLVTKRDNFRAGVRAAADIGCHTAINTRLMFVPWAEHEVELKQIFNGTLISTTSARGWGGFGVMWDVAGSYRITENLSAEVGYQLWFEEIDHGDTLKANGTLNSRFQGGELSSFRHGALIGVSYRF
jgi:ferredoxin